MKLQHYAVIFIIIVLPISFLLSGYTQYKMEEINLSSEYDTRISEATYDAVKSFELNIQDEPDSLSIEQKKKEVGYAIETFYKTLGNRFLMSNIDSNALKDYTPAIMFSLYDGFFIQSKYKNIENNKYEYGLRPYELYSCRYVKDTNYDFIVNYTLDNYITVYGKVNGGTVNKSGYLIDIRKIDADTKNKIEEGREQEISELYFDELKIEKENLRKYEIKNENGTMVEVESSYQSDGALEYYISGYKFTKWVQDNLSEIKPSDSLDSKTGASIRFSINSTINNEKIFKIGDNNIPENKDSVFSMHREAVIRKKIEDSLITAIANFNQYSTTNYEFTLPQMRETDWEKITRKVCMTSFVQGLSIKGKYNNSYATIVSNENSELIDKDNLYFIAKDNNIHTINCKELIEHTKNDESYIITGYKKSEFNRRKIQNQESSETYYYYSQVIEATSKNYTKCFKCITGMSDVYNIDEVLKGNIKDKNGNTIYNEDDLISIRKLYYTCLAREKYNLRN